MGKYKWNYPTTMWVGENRINDIAEACKNLGIAKPAYESYNGVKIFNDWSLRVYDKSRNN